MSLILLPHARLKRQPQYPTPLVDPGFWRLVDIQNQPPLGKSRATRALVGTAKADYGVGGSCVNFVAVGDRIDYGANPDLQLSSSSGICVVEVPNANTYSLFCTSTAIGPGAMGGFFLEIESSYKVRIINADIALIAVTAKAVIQGKPNAIAWSYNNITGDCKIAINGVLETFNSPQTLTHNGVSRNGYYPAPSTQSSNPCKQYLFAISASTDVSGEQLRDWSIDPWQIFKAQPRVLPSINSTPPPSSSGLGFIKVSGSWKNLSGVYVNVAGTWKSGQFSPNVSGSWKTLA